MSEDEVKPDPMAIATFIALLVSSALAALLSLVLLLTSGLGTFPFLALLWVGPVAGWVAMTRSRYVIALLAATGPLAAIAAGFWALGTLSRLIGP